jgi:hypothetical protein
MRVSARDQPVHEPPRRWPSGPHPPRLQARTYALTRWGISMIRSGEKTVIGSTL